MGMLSQTVARPQAAAAAPVVVRVSRSNAAGSYRIGFARAGRSAQRPVMLHGTAEMAWALHLSGAPVRPDMNPARSAALVMTAIERHGQRVVREQLARDSAISALVVRGEATAGQLREQARAWGGRRREQACIDAAFRLSCAAERGELSGEVA